MEKERKEFVAPLVVSYDREELELGKIVFTGGQSGDRPSTAP